MSPQYTRTTRPLAPLSRVLLAAGILGAGLSGWMPASSAYASDSMNLFEDPPAPERGKRSDGGPATDAFKQKHEVVVGLVTRNAKDKEIEAQMDALLDYPWLSRASLGGENRYAETCGARCDEFESLLTKVVRDNYLQLVRRSSKQPLTFVSEQAGRNDTYKIDAKVQTEKHGRLQNVDVSFIVHKVGDKWAVRDIITDGVSLAKTYRYEFAKQLKQGGIDAVIDGLKTRASTKPARGEP